MTDDKTDRQSTEKPAGGGIAGDGPLIRPPKRSLWGNVWSSFLAGIVVIAPIGITVALVYWFVTGPMARLDTFVKRAIPDSGGTLETITRAIPGLGVLIAIVAIILLGAFAKNFVGRAFIRTGENLLDSIPVIRNLYRFFKNVFETALQQSERSFKEVALIEYPRPGLWVMAFVVGETKGEIRYRLSDAADSLVSVFVPTVPNPTSGFLLFLPRSSIRPLSMSVEDAAKAIFSIGLVTPEFADPDAAVKKLQEMVEEAQPEKKPRRAFFRAKTNK
ncbi:DUF502 domain-containing protein [Amphiplicatus metriothermophilus]|uniref:Uncharacterized membrane protein n=1 Tax=Amphiplicatus metriothermophilus TaxID=1519374 RepID=A0A239PPL1_9PROT|nr:DUF502 domain-containing protein [Amphiplicatus metriothermophilus]MBB5518637.1 putative membrane protein [Amphiplicatus metriothermophilus]SNT72205.1 Uncharacterized membrane protein [Amphiplicatus metriothermophilus]